MKLTKKSYNRRVYTFGVMIFSAIALISTGFATWVMSTNANTSINGSATVGTITDGSMTFKDVAFKDGVSAFSFNPDIDDKSGEILSDGKTAPVLTVTLTGKIEPAKYFDSLTIRMTEVSKGLLEAVGKKYIVLPTCYSTDLTGAVKVEDVKIDNSTDVVTFSYDIEIKWGDAFKGHNPSKYLDGEATDVPETPYTYEEKKAILIDLRRTIYEMKAPETPEQDTDATFTDEEVMTEEPSVQPSYKVELIAQAKVVTD